MNESMGDEKSKMTVIATVGPKGTANSGSQQFVHDALHARRARCGQTT